MTKIKSNAVLSFSKFSINLLSSLLLMTTLSSCAHLMDKSQDREKARIFLQLAADQFSMREYSKAADSAQQALRYDPEFPATHNHLGIIYMETKRYARSEESFKKALALQPDYPEIYNNLGVLFNRQEKYTQAIPYFEKALSYEAYPTPENALTNLGIAYLKLGQNPKAKAYHQKALDITPEFCLANKNMGDVYAKEKNFQKATEFFQKAVTTCPLYEESRYKLGLAYMKLGQKNIAKTHFEKLIDRSKNGPYVERSQEVLKYLQ